MSPTKLSTAGSNFSTHKRSPSIQTFDSLDFARGSDDGTERSMDKIAVLEFELRKAKETIKSLRAALTMASTIETPSVIVSAATDPSSLKDKSTESNSETGHLQRQVRQVDESNTNELQKERLLNVVDGDVNDGAKIDVLSTSSTIDSKCESLTYDPEKISSSDVSRLMSQVKDMDTPSKPHEKRAINFLVHDFLMKNSLRMTAITLSEEEHDQDFESWFDVGLNLPPPPSLLHLYRFYLWSLTHSNQLKDEIKGTPSSTTRNTLEGDEKDSSNQKSTSGKTEEKVQLIDCETQTTREIDPIPRGLEEERDEHQSDTSYSLNSFEDVGDKELRRNEKVKGKQRQETKMDSVDQSTQTDKLLSFLKRTIDYERQTKGNDSDSTDKLEEQHHEEKKTMDWSPFQRVLMEESGLMSLSDTCFDLIDSREGLIHLLAYDFPSIVANHKEEHKSDLMPLLVSTIHAIRDREMRDSLLTSFFDLILSPNDFERRMIVSALISLGNKMAAKSVEETLLPLIWEGINHKIRERRILVSEACVSLLPLVSSEMRGSLVFSIISQILLEDKDLVVKESALKAMSVIMTIFAEEEVDDKIDILLKQILPRLVSDLNRVCETTDALNDVSVTSFRKTMIKYFIPSLSYWSLHTKKMTPLSNELVDLTLSVVSKPGYHELTAMTLVCALEAIIPFLFVSLVNSMPSTSGGSSSTTGSISNPTTSPSKNIESHRYCFISNKLLNMNLISRTTSVNPLITRFDQYITRDWFKPWNEWENMFEKFLLPTLINDIIPRVANDHKNLHSCLIDFTSSFGQHFGLSVIRSKAKPLFLKVIYMKMNESSIKDASHGNGVLLLPCLAALLISIKPIQVNHNYEKVITSVIIISFRVG